MSIKNQSKLNRLLSIAPDGVVLTSSWLLAQGYSLQLQARYKKSQWFESFGRGALVRNGDTVDYLGGIQALQTQLNLSVHPAAKTALVLQGKSHYLEFSTQKAQLFSAKSEVLPAWFKKRDWEVKLESSISSFLPVDLGMVEYQHTSFSIKISSPARAIMECLYLAPNEQPLLEVYELMEGLNNIRPITAQKLLESCSSVKVKRLFLYMADKAGHDWLTYVNQDNVDLGKGKRQIVSDGVYIPKYQITVPKELETHK
ncbi:type IV toxin-antitoxin system AbiEi family antitoxin [Thalassotalea litorea]|uniref:type IV toxin-antitoxin system AbiEi family antitoxin n=1 Tax=Thalassotalea litorea TaxID=2020715 RepID=UPI0037360D1E